MEIKLRLQELIKNSPAIQSLLEADREARTKAMLSADDDTMNQFIAVLENEAAQMQKLDSDMASKTEEINSLLAEANQLEKEAQREIRKEAEASERAGEESKAEDLLKQLDDIADADKEEGEK